MTVCDETLVILADPLASDGEALAKAHAHATACPRCSSAIDEAPFDTGPVHDAITVPWRLRASLAVVSGLQFLVALPWLAGFNTFGALGQHVDPAHLTRDGALGIVTAIAGLLTVWRPRYAVPAVAVSVTAVTILVIMALLDDHAHRVTIAFEFVHLLTISTTILVIMHRRGDVSQL